MFWIALDCSWGGPNVWEGGLTDWQWVVNWTDDPHFPILFAFSSNNLTFFVWSSWTSVSVKHRDSRLCWYACHCLFVCWFMRGDTSPCLYVVQQWTRGGLCVSTPCDSVSSHSRWRWQWQLRWRCRYCYELILRFGFLCLVDLARNQRRNRRHCNRSFDICSMSWFTVCRITEGFANHLNSYTRDSQEGEWSKTDPSVSASIVSE